MWGKRDDESAFAWLELAFLLAFLALLFQVFPSLWFTLVWALDVRNWSHWVWFSANVAFVLALCGIRFGPHVLQSWRESRARVRVQREKQEKQRELKEQLETLKRTREARKRQIF